MTDLIKGKSAEEAIAILENLPKSTSLPLGRVVRSAIAKTTYGTIGVKAWVYKGEIEPAPRQVTQPSSAGATSAPRPPAPAPVPAPARAS